MNNTLDGTLTLVHYNANVLEAFNSVEHKLYHNVLFKPSCVLESPFI